MSRNSRIYLSLSLGLNALLGGILIGQFWQQDTGTARALSERPLLQLARTLPAELRPPLRQALYEQRVPLFNALDDSRQAIQQIQYLARQPQVQKEVLEQAFGQLQTSLNQLQQPLYSAMIQAVLATPPEARARWQPQIPGLSRAEGLEQLSR